MAGLNLPTIDHAHELRKRTIRSIYYRIKKICSDGNDWRPTRVHFEVTKLLKGLPIIAKLKPNTILELESNKGKHIVILKRYGIWGVTFYHIAFMGESNVFLRHNLIRFSYGELEQCTWYSLLAEDLPLWINADYVCRRYLEDALNGRIRNLAKRWQLGT